MDILPTKGEPRYMDFRRVRGGLLAQTPDYITEKELTPKTVTSREPTPQEREELSSPGRQSRSSSPTPSS